MNRTGLVHVATREEFVDMAGRAWGTYAEAHKASVHGLLAAFLADQALGDHVEAADAVAAALLESFVVVPRETR